MHSTKSMKAQKKQKSAVQKKAPKKAPLKTAKRTITSQHKPLTKLSAPKLSAQHHSITMVNKRQMSFMKEDPEPVPIPNYTPPAPIPHSAGSRLRHNVEADRDGFKKGEFRELTNIVRGSWTQRPVLNYNIVQHLGREPEEIDTLKDGARIFIEPSQFTPVDYASVPTIDELSSKRSDRFMHHNEMLRIKAASAAAPNIDEQSKKSIDRWMNDFRGHVWQPEVQSYQTQQSRGRMRLIDHHGLSYGNGGRKTSKAQAILKPGLGLMFVNGKPYTEYFCATEHRSQLGMPFYTTGTVGQFDVFLTIKGGGPTGQADAAKLAIANALQNFEPQFRPTLKVNRLLKRDARTVERKHVGHKKARKSFTWVKR